ncbi:hypothetical protein ASE74_20660 [Pedobacter sp. Leaf216]|uniref:hypothetical protein n=1 Tax=Pedobacter sp. Leaf216 TaxID=1735684 RepID=UPI0006FB20A8|nr:hypothetical protein [Pedobacter sp. Leaf216]KQM75234.1 hypothetical protein ASE74_20660 [Pedobacter sp. Leaf216]
MFAEFIYRPPSGEYQEKHFGDTASDCSWVKFTTDVGDEWVGSFQNGWLDNSRIIKLLDRHEKAFIVANGAAYLINTTTRQLVNSTEISDVKTVLVDNDQYNTYYSNGYDLRFIDIHGSETCLFEYNGFDDVQLTNIKDNKLYATYFHYQDSNKQFHIELDLITKQVRDSLYDATQPATSETAQNVKDSKPWWRLW